MPPQEKNSDNIASLTDRLLVWLAAGGGLGFAPFAPGTFGSLGGLVLAWADDRLPFWGRLIAAAVWFVVGIPLCGRAARILGLKDPGLIVYDEIAAFPVLFLPWEFNLWTAVLGFVLFRIFDIAKPWPARRLERLPGGLGIMADDFAAALYASAVLWLIDRLIPLS